MSKFSAAMQEAGTLIDQEQLDELKDELHVPSKYI
jgi:hypothetical protein